MILVITTMQISRLLNRLARLIGIALLPPMAFAQTQEIIQSTTGPCSPAIGVNYGQITLNCPGLSDEVVSKLQALPSVKEYNRQANALQDLQISVYELRQATFKAKVSSTLNLEGKSQAIRTLQTELILAKERLSELVERQSKLENEVSKTIANLPEVSADASTEVRDQIRRDIQSSIAAVSNRRFFRINSDMQALDMRLTRLEQDVERLQGDVSLLMKEYLGGELVDSFGFIGVGIGAFVVNDDAFARLSIEYELLAPRLPVLNLRGSGFIELGYLDWDETQKYSTLPGVPDSEFKEDNSFGYVGIGSRIWVLPLGDFAGIYTALSGGYSIFGEEQTFYVSPAVGLEYFRKSARLALEIRWDWLSSIEERTIKFNPLGVADINDETSDQTAFTVGARVSFR